MPGNRDIECERCHLRGLVYVTHGERWTEHYCAYCDSTYRIPVYPPSAIDYGSIITQIQLNNLHNIESQYQEQIIQSSGIPEQTFTGSFSPYQLHYEGVRRGVQHQFTNPFVENATIASVRDETSQEDEYIRRLLSTPLDAPEGEYEVSRAVEPHRTVGKWIEEEIKFND